MKFFCSAVDIGWIDVEQYINYFSALLLYKIIRMRQPLYLADLFVRNKNRSSSRAAAKGYVRAISFPESRVDAGFYSFKTQGARLWNLILSNIQFLPSLCKYKSALRKYFRMTQLNQNKFCSSICGQMQELKKSEDEHIL